MRSRSRLNDLGATEAVGKVVGLSSRVAIHIHNAISLIGVDLGGVRAVDRDGLVVDAKTVSVGVSVREESSLEHLVRRGLDPGNHVRGSEGNLLHFGKVVLRVAVEHHAADLDEWEGGVRPDLGDIEGIEGVGCSLLRSHHLDVHSPRGEIPIPNHRK